MGSSLIKTGQQGLPDGAVTANKIANNAVTTPKLNTGVLQAGRNKIINGNFNIFQRASASAVSSAYTLDRWRVGSNTTSATVNVTQSSTVPSGTTANSSLLATVATADGSVATSDLFIISQRIEGYNFLALKGKTFTLSFWVRSNITGTYCVSLRSNANDSYIAEYTINAANTWEYKTITITHDTSGTWVYNSGIGLDLAFVLMAGSDFTNTPNTWRTATNDLATNNQVNFMVTSSNTFYLSQVQLELGDTATEFEYIDYGTELLKCYRYTYVLAADGGNANAYLAPVRINSSTGATGVILMPTEMRTVPSISVSDHSHFAVSDLTGDRTASAHSISALSSLKTIRLDITISSAASAGDIAFWRCASSSARAIFSAEL